MGTIHLVPSDFEDVFLISPYQTSDDRGMLIKTYAKDQFLEHGINFSLVEETFVRSNNSVLRGLHYQRTLNQSKLITCVLGRAQLVIVNIDKKSAMFGKWISYELTPSISLYIPGHYAIGTYAMEDSLFHLGYGEEFIAGFSSGIRWDDIDIGIEWWINKEPFVSEKDLKLPYLKELVQENIL